MNYFTISRIRQHLEKRSNGPCLTRMIAHNLTVPESKIKDINEQQTRESAVLARGGFKPHHASKLAVRIIGPVLGRGQRAEHATMFHTTCLRTVANRLCVRSGCFAL
jgi:hypothetical protein